MFTVEDVNGVLVEYDFVNVFHTVDVGLLSIHSYGMVDFCTIREVSSTKLEVRVDNSLWSGGFYCLISDSYVNSSALSYSLSDGVLSITFASGTNLSNVKIVLYLSSFYDTFTLNYLEVGLSDFSVRFDAEYPVTALKSGISTTTGWSASIDGDTLTGSVSDGKVSFDLNGAYGDMTITYDNSGAKSYFYTHIKELKSFPVVTGSDTVYRSVNSLEFSVANFGGDTVSVEFDGETTECEVSSNSFTYDLDLREYTGSKATLLIRISETDTNYGTNIEWKLNVEDVTVTTFNQLKSAIQDKTPKILIGVGITFASDLTIDYNATIKGKDRERGFTMRQSSNSYKIIVEENSSLTLENIGLQSGKPPFLMKEGSTLNLNTCTTGIQQRNGVKGTIIQCDLTVDDIYVENKITANINNCTFINNYEPFIDFDGILNIKNTKFKLTSAYLNTSSNSVPAFINLVDGEAHITDSAFEISFTDNAFHGVQYCNFLLGENARLNGLRGKDLKANNTLNGLFESPYNNTSTINIKYPKNGQTITLQSSKGCLHSIAGDNKIYKNNITIT